MIWNKRFRRRDLFGLIAGAGLVPIMKPTSAVGASAFPVTVDHALGTTRIMEEPKRIVTLGWNGEDAIVALGQLPIAMPKRALFDSGIFPWVEDKLGAAKPHLLTNDLDYEMLVALRPDLILAVFSGVDDNAYKRLSRIAPTVVYTSGVWQADWREQILQTGRALGKETDAVALIDQTNQLVNALGKQYSELEGKTFTFGTFSAGSNAIGAYLPADPRIAMLMELGLKASPGIVELASQDEKARSTSVSLENIGSIDADILIMWYGEGARDAAEAQPLFAALNAVKRGSYVALDDPVSVWSTSALSVLSIPYGFPKFVPRLAEAARKAEQ